MKKDTAVLVWVCSQPGATKQNFDKEAFGKKYVAPARAILASGLIQKIIFVTPCDPKCDIAETGYSELRSGEDLPHHVVTPTTLHTRTCMKKEFADRTVENLDVSVWGESPDSIISYSIGFAKNSGTTKVVYIEHGGEPPSLGRLAEILSDLTLAEADVYPSNLHLTRRSLELAYSSAV